MVLLGASEERGDGTFAGAAAVELGFSMSRDEARLRAEYGLALREIVRRLTAERAERERQGATGGDRKRGYRDFSHATT